jgi:lysophospholipase L1-like esterase
MRKCPRVIRSVACQTPGYALAVTFALACSSGASPSTADTPTGGSGGSAGTHAAGTASGGNDSGGSNGSGGSETSGAAAGGSSGFTNGGAIAGSGGASPSAGAAGVAGSGAGGTTMTGGQPNGGTSGAAAGGSSSVEELVHFYGRWNQLADRAITVNSGSQVSAQFTGTQVRARFDIASNVAGSIPTIAWRVDQGAWQEAEIATTVSLATSLAPGSHTVTVLARGLDETRSRWAPPLESSITFLGFDVTDGTVQASARPVRPKVEILGDSITEGVKIWSSHEGKTGAAWVADARISYPFQTAEQLGAELRQVGFGYLGILKSGNGGVPKANDSFNWTYEGVPRDSWQADMVVVNEGTNDSSQNATTFREGYLTYLTTIRAAYQSAKIVALRPFNGSQAAQVQAAVQARNAAGDTKTYYVDTSGWLVSADYTDGLHPNAQGSGKAAKALSAALMGIGLP